MLSTTIIDSYSIGMTTNIIKLKITIEPGQMAKSTVRLDTNTLGDFNDSFEVDLGKASDIMGRIVYVDTTEAASNPESNITSFKLELNGAASAYSKQQTQPVKFGDSVMFNAEISLIP
jgi:hypothetical protein